MAALYPPAPTRAETAQSAGPGRCMDSYDPIYLADRRVAIRGIMRGCENGAYDVTPAPYAIQPGERLMIATGRYLRQLPNAIVRARLNTPYLLNPMHQADMNAVPYVANGSWRWHHGIHALPFVPTRILNMGTQQGFSIYAYSTLLFLPSRVNDAYPLSASSVIIAIDGYMFSSPDALAAMLAERATKDYVEVTYYQEGERGRPLRRAYLPLYPRSFVNAEWTRLTQAAPIFEPDLTGRIYAVAGVLIFARLVYEFTQSELGQALIREYQECVRRREPGITC